MIRLARQTSNMMLLPDEEVWLITRSDAFAYNHRISYRWVNDLAPSNELYEKYLKSRNQNQWNAQQFNAWYVPQFISELVSNPTALNILDNLYYLGIEGRNIVLTCACRDEQVCHRSIVGGILLGAYQSTGIESKINCNPQYIRYWNLYQSAWKLQHT